MIPRLITSAGWRKHAKCAALAVIAVGLLAGRASAQSTQPTPQQLSENCTVSVLNRNVRVSSDGSWLLSNVPANFGYVRARVTCTIDGRTLSGESDPFLVSANGTVEIPPIALGQTTPIPASVSIVADTHILTPTLPSLELTVTAHYPDNSTRDVRRVLTGTTYATSNENIVAVSQNGLLTAIAPGSAIIQATHLGATGIFAVQVSASGSDTDGDGIPDDNEVTLGLNPTNPVDAAEDFDRDGLTNLQEFQQGTDLRNADTDGDSVRDGDEVQTYSSSPLLRDTDGDSIPDGIEVASGTNPADSSNYNLSKALKAVVITPAQFTLTFNTIAGDVSRQLTVTGTLVDGTSINLTARQNDTQITSSDLSVCNFGATAGQVFAGQTGTCTISATAGGFTAQSIGTVHTFSPTSLSFVTIPGYANNLDVSGDVVYVAAGSAGLQIVDVSNRNSPSIVASLALPGNANDVKVAGGRAFVAGGTAGLHVVDVTTPTSPQLLGSVLLPGDAWDVRTSGHLAFVAAGSGGLQIVDVSNAVAPRIVGALPLSGVVTGVDVTGTLAALTVDSTLRVIDVLNPASPVLLGSVTLANAAKDVAVRGAVAYVADFEGSLQIVNLGNPGAPQVIGVTTQALGGILQDVAVSDNFAFGADVLFVNGVPIVDITTPGNPIPRAILNFATFRDDNGTGIAVDGSYVYLTASLGIQDNGSTGDTRLYIGQYRLVEDLDGIAPTISIMSPADDATFVEGETIPIAVSAADDIAVASVQAMVNGTVVSTDSSAPYLLSAVAPIGATSITLGASATDLGGNVGVATAIQVNVIPDPLTSVTGRVLAPDATPVSGATVTCLTRSSTTSPGGTFVVADVPTSQPAFVCTADFTTEEGFVLHGSSASLSPVRGGTTNAGDITLALVPVVVSTTALPNGFLGQPYHETLTASGTIGTVAWSLNAASNPLPNGLVLSADGVISGTPTTYGSTPAFTVRATDSLGRSGIGVLSIFVDADLQILTTSLKEGIVLENFNQALVVIGGHGGRAFTLVGGSMPPGMTPNGGAPRETGTYTFTIQVTDCSPAETCAPGTPQQTASQTFTLRVSAREQQAGGQANTPISFGGPGGRRVAQVATVGANGMLNAFGLTTLTCPTVVPVTVEVQRLTLNGVPDGTTIASGTSTGNGFNGIALSPTIPVAIDERLAFVVSSPTACTLNNTPTNDNNYQAGDAYVDAGGGWVTLLSTDGRYDIPFRTLIEPAKEVVYFNRGRFDGARASALSGGDKVLITGTDNTGDIYDQATNKATVTPAMNVAPQRFSHTSTLLDDGTVLIAGGRNSTATTTRLTSAEIYDPATGVYTPTGSMAIGRESAAAIKLPNGRVLIIGGNDGALNLGSVEIYDPITKTFSSAGTMTTQRNWPVVALLGNGKVLIAAGYMSGSNQRSAELYDPAVGTFTATVGNMVVNNRGRATATLLNDGRVLITGGQSGDIRAEAEIYNPATDSFTATSTTMTTKRFTHTATLLSDGSVLIAGGFDSQNINSYILPLATMERYVPATNSFVPAGSLVSRRASHVATQLANGKVLLIGGVSQNSWFIGDTGELYDLAATPVLTTTSLPDGQIGTPYSGGPLVASGGHAPYTITHVSGVLPPGLNYDPGSASLTGTPLATGIFLLGFKVTDSDGHSNVQVLTVRLGTVNIITSPYRLPDAGRDNPYSVQLAATGTGPIAWSPLPSSSPLPLGLSLSSTGVISGTPTTNGFINFAVRAIDATGQAAVKSFSINVVNPLVLNTLTLPDGAVREFYSICLSASNGVGARTFTAGPGLPPGVILNTNGCFANPPTTHGTFTFTAQVADSTSPPTVVARQFTIRVAVKDQEGFSNSGSTMTFGGPGGRRIAQTVTVGATGMLTAFGFNNILTCQSPSVSVDVQRLTLTGLPDGNTIATGSATTGFNGVAVSPPIPVAVDTRLAFVINSAGLCTLTNASTNDYYQAGDGYAEVAGAWVPLATTDGRHDLPFRTLILPDKPVTYLNLSRDGATATVLNDGTVLIAGNNSVSELYDPATGLSTPAGAMSAPRFAAAATLTNGLVLIAGGSVNNSRLSSAQTYDPSTGVFTNTANGLSVARDSAAAVTLADGRVLIVGGYDGANSVAAADLYDPVTRTFTPIGNMLSARNSATATLLANGKVLIAGGYISGQVSAELYDPLAGPNGSFTATVGSMVVFSRGPAAAVRLGNGHVLITGGQSGDIVSSAETYDPSTGMFTATGNMSVPRVGHTATVLPDGSALIAGGWDAQSVNSYTLPLATLERYDPVSRTFKPAGSMVTRRARHKVVPVTDGKLLIVGGASQSWMTGNTAELYDAATAPAITPALLPDGQLGVPYPTTTLSGSGPGAPFTIVQATGILPPGLQYDAQTRTLSGTPTVSGVFPVGFRVTSTLSSNVQALSIRVGNILVITSPYRLVDGALNQPYTLQLTANGSAPIAWSIPAGASGLPPGLTLSSAGVISGTPIASGYYNFEVRAIDATGQSALKALSISVQQNALSISTTTLPEASALEGYGFCIGTANGIGNRTFSITQNSPPPGMVLQMNGCFANAPTAYGTYPFTVRVTDSASPPQVVTRSFTIRVSAREQTGYTDNGPAMSFGGVGLGARRLAQTVTVGANGTLTAFGMNQLTTCAAPGLISIAVQRVTGAGVPDGTTIASGQADTGFEGIALTPAVPVAIGMRLAFIVSSTSPCTLVNGSTWDFYQNGDGLADAGNGWTSLVGTDGRYDIPFKMLIQPAMPVTPLYRARGGHTATVLQDGKVLLAGSEVEAELFDPATNATTLTGSMSVRRYGPAAVRLNDGTVLIAGGGVDNLQFDTAETYNPATGTFTPTANRMSAKRSTPTATKLLDGRVLVAGGYDGVNSVKSADIYDPATRTFTPLTMTTARNVHTATLLADGTVLLAGGFTDGSPTAFSAEIFNPATLTFTPTLGSVVTWRGWAFATLLTDGRVLITGGQAGDIVNSAEIYDPATGLFTATGAMSVRRNQHTATLLADGSVLVAGGVAEPSFWGYTRGHATMERWVPATGTFVRAGAMEAERFGHTAVRLSDNRILLAGGFAHSGLTGSAAELFQLGASPTLTTTQLPDGQQFIAYPAVTLAAAGGAGAPFAIDLVAGGLPFGMSYDPATATLSGTPAFIGVYTLGMRVRDAAGQTNLQSLTLRVSPITVTSPYRLPDGRLGQPYAIQLTSTPSGATWSLTQLSVLPPGLSMNGSGVISGTPTGPGYYNFVVRATDSFGQSTLKVLSIFVN